MEVNSTSATTGNSSSASLNRLSQDFDQFLRLLTTQLQNQDPLSPMDSTEFTNQLVSFSQVEQQIKMNDQMETLIAFQTLNLTAVGLGFIGKNVEVQGSEFYNDGTTGAKMSYVMPAGAEKGTVAIKNSAGDTVYTTEANLTQGSHTVTWDGKDLNGLQVPAGKYTFEVSALGAENAALNITKFVPGYVAGLETADDGNLNLIINDNRVPITDVRTVTVASAI